MAYLCRIKPKHAIGRLQYKGKTFTKHWTDTEIDVSATNSMIECFEVKSMNQVEHEQKASDGIPDIESDSVERQKTLHEMTKKELLTKAKDLGIETVGNFSNKADLIEEIELSEMGGIE